MFLLSPPKAKEKLHGHLLKNNNCILILYYRAWRYQSQRILNWEDVLQRIGALVSSGLSTTHRHDLAELNPNGTIQDQ
jgi:hypothetical protein